MTTACDVCNKSTLSLLLLRPSPVAKLEALKPPGSSAVLSDDADTKDLLPSRAPTESRFALRLLRAGYVHVYMETPPPGVKDWQVFRVTESADLIPQGTAWFTQVGDNKACTTEGHNDAGIKLLNIPQAHLVKEIWIAYSANLWNDKLRNNNKANPEVMQKISLAGGSPNTFQPTLERLKTKVLECALATLSIGGNKEHDFPFHSQVQRVTSLVSNLKRAAACHPKTRGKELAVVLRDPVGIATELNELRLRRNELAKQFIGQPQNALPLNSSNAVLGLKQSIINENLQESYKVVSPLRFRQAFEESQPHLPPDTEWVPLEGQERKDMKLGATMAFWRSDEIGRVVFPDHDARAIAWAKEHTEKSWKDFAPHYDEGARSAWIANFEARLKTEHYDPLAKFEDDWFAAAQDTKTLNYFAKHFDPEERNDPLKLLCPGTIYASESHYIHQPAPHTTGAVLDLYLAMLDKPIKDDKAVVQRALVANQKTVIDKIHEQLTGDANSTGIRDENYEFMKGVLSDGPGKNFALKYRWVGDTVSMFSVGQLTAVTGALMLSLGRNAKLSPSFTAQLAKVQRLWGVQQVVGYATASAIKGVAPKMPVLITMMVNVEDALEVIRAREGQNVGTSKSRVKRTRKSGGKVRLAQLTDTDALKEAHGDVKKLMLDPAQGSVQMGAGAKTAIVTSTIPVLSQQQFLTLYGKQSALGERATNALRQSVAESLQTGSGMQARTITMSLEGRLALGAVVVQFIGLYHGLRTLDNAKTEEDIRNAWYGVFDSGAGMLAGAFELWAIAANANIIATAGEAAAKTSMRLAAARFLGGVAAASGGVMMGISSWVSAEKAKRTGDIRVSNFYKLSSVAFFGTAAPATILASAKLAETLLARNVGGAAARIALTRVAGASTASILGLSLTGWGLVLLGAAIVYQITAVAMTPTPTQRWLSRSYFGKDPSWLDWDGKRDDMFKKGDWKSELEALEQAIKEAMGEPEQAAKPESQAKQVSAVK